MSKSRHSAARENIHSAPQNKGTLFKRPQGGVRTGWLLAVSLLCVVAVSLGLRLALSAMLSALFRAWGVDADSVIRAPGWARLLFRWQGSLVTVAVSAALLALSTWLRRLWLGKDDKPHIDAKCFAVFSAAGIGLALFALLFALIPDSIRPEWPLSAPRLTWSLLMLCAVSLLSALAEEAFTKRALYDGIKSRWGIVWSTAITCAAFFLMNGGMLGNLVSDVNVLLMGLMCCLLYEKRGLWAAVGLRWGWGVATVFLMGYGGGEASVYRFYGVSESLMTGGDAGPAYGLWTTILLAACLIIILLQAKNATSFKQLTKNMTKH